MGHTKVNLMPSLGPLQLAILSSLWDSNRYLNTLELTRKVSDHDLVCRQVSRNVVSQILIVLRKKRWIKRRRTCFVSNNEPKYEYMSVITREELIQQMIDIIETA